MMDLIQANLVNENNTIDGLFHIKLTKKRFEDFLNKAYLKDIEVEQEVKNYKILCLSESFPKASSTTCKT